MELPKESRKYSILRKRRLKRLERDYENEADILFPRKVRKLNKLTVAEKTRIVHEVVIGKSLHHEVAFQYQVNVRSVDLLVQRIRKNPKYLNELMKAEEKKELEQ